MDAVVETCLNCGDPLTEPRKLKDFCTYSCRGQHAVNTLPGVPHRGAYSGSKNLKKTRALHTLRKQSLGAITFCKINSVTYRIDRRTKNGVGWLMEVAWPGESRQRWVARVGDRASDPLPLEQAKAAAKDLLSTAMQASRSMWLPIRAPAQPLSASKPCGVYSRNAGSMRQPQNPDVMRLATTTRRRTNSVMLD